jgi:hypothetical protein
VPRDLSIAVHWRTLLYTFRPSIATGLLSGLTPAAVARPIPANALKGEDSLGRPGNLCTLPNVLVA